MSVIFLEALHSSQYAAQQTVLEVIDSVVARAGVETGVAKHSEAFRVTAVLETDHNVTAHESTSTTLPRKNPVAPETMVFAVVWTCHPC